MKLLLLDLDGTLREPKSGAKFINNPLDQKPIDKAFDMCTNYQELGWFLIGVSNQGGVAAGHKSLESAIAESQETLRLFPQLLFIYFCPDYEGLHCYKVTREEVSPIFQESANEFGSFRKPGAGMPIMAIRYYLPEEILMVGDRPEDEQAARNARIHFNWAEDWRNGKH